MIIYISGGCKNGKSGYAEKIANYLKDDNNKFYYIATMCSSDTEDDERIERHRKEREKFNFKTIEIKKNIKDLENICDLQGTFLIDSVTALLSNEMFLTDGQFLEDAFKKVTDDLIYIIKKLKNVVIVSDYIFSDSIFYDKYTENYRKGLAFIDKACAKECDVLIEICYGNMIAYKGNKVLKEMQL